MRNTKVSALAIMLGVIGAPAMASQKDMALCGKLADAWKAAYDARDAAKVAALYDPAAGYYSNPFWTAAGRGGIEKGLKADFSMDGAFSDITCEAAERDGNLLVAHGTYVGSAKGPDGQTMPMKGHWFAAARETGGKYLMTTHNANMQMPPPK